MTGHSGSFKSARLVVAAATVAIVQAGCGGSSSSAPTVSGLAATGAGIANATVTAKCAGGAALSGTTDASGSYTLVLDGRTLPCMVQVRGGTVSGAASSVILHSFAQAAGRVNITPVTDLIVARALGSNPETAFAGYTNANGSTIEGALTTAKTYVATQISAITGSSIADPLTGTFVVGDADDKVLDALGSALTKASKTMSDLRSAAQTGATLTTIVPPISTSGGGTSSASLPDGLKGKVKATVYASAQSGSPYANGDLLTFTFSSSGLLMYGLTSANTSTHSTVSTFSKVGSEYVWVDTANNRRFAVSLKGDGSFHEINVSSADGSTFWGQFTESGSGAGGGGGNGGSSSLTLTGAVSTLVARSASIGTPGGMVSDGTYLYVSSNSTNTIRKIDANSGAVSTLAGNISSGGSADGTGTAAQFSGPTGLATDGTHLYVADNGNNAIRRVTIATGVVTTVAGTVGTGGAGNTNGVGSAAKFHNPRGVAHHAGMLYVADKNNNKIRRVDLTTGTVTDFASVNDPIAVTTDGTHLYVATQGITQDIRKLAIATPATVTVVAGKGIQVSSCYAHADGVGTLASFCQPWGLTVHAGVLYVADNFMSGVYHNSIRRIDLTTNNVTTIAGSQSSNNTNGTGASASFVSPRDVVVHGGKVYVADGENYVGSGYKGNEIRAIQ